jgi:hypothetical protein
MRWRTALFDGTGKQMSFTVTAFLGGRTSDLEARFVRTLAELGFEVRLHPEMRLVVGNTLPYLCLAILQTPPKMSRLEPSSALLLAFDYSLHKKPKGVDRSPSWPPRNVKRYSYEVSSRSAAGRAASVSTMQMLCLAILAKETDGYVHFDGDERAFGGDAAVARVVRELAWFNDVNFDAYASRFVSWPPLADFAYICLPQEILPPETPKPSVPPRRFKFKYKFSLIHIPAVVLLLYFTVATILYS